MRFGRATGLNIAGTDRDIHRVPVLAGLAAAFYDRVKAVFPEAVIFFPLSLNESLAAAFRNNSLTGRIAFRGSMIMGAGGGLCLWGDAADSGAGGGLRGAKQADDE
jgi:hypothetical protein